MNVESAKLVRFHGPTFREMTEGNVSGDVLYKGMGDAGLTAAAETNRRMSNNRFLLTWNAVDSGMNASDDLMVWEKVGWAGSNWNFFKAILSEEVG